MILHADGDTPAQLDEAKSILGLLWAAYPGHPWSVAVKGGVIFIRHLEFPANWGMATKFKDVQHDATTLKATVVKSAGEWLERANLKRGRSNGDEIGRVEGVPEKNQPHGTVEAAQVVVGDTEERTVARPQATRH